MRHLTAAALVLCGAVLALAWPGAARAAEMRATLDTHRVGVGETATLEIMVSGGGLLGNVAEPELHTPPGLQVVGAGRAQNFSWVNGRASNETVFRYEVGAGTPGKFVIGPIRVRAGNQVLQAPALMLEVVAGGAPRAGGGPVVAGRDAPALLLADVTPREPYVGQPMMLRVRLVQRAQLAEEPVYTPPTTTGFWAEPGGQPETYYAMLNGERVLVTEQRSRLYPLAPGRATIGEGTASLVLSSADNPLLWAMGRVPRREFSVRSAPVVVSVRPLPGGAPAGFDGAVGHLSVTWTADRTRTSQDVPVTVRYDVRGIGNLPLVHTPEFDPPDAEVFASTLDDSFGPPGATGPGRRRFQWNVLPRHTGRLTLEAPPLVWFDPDGAQYRRVVPPPLQLEIGPPVSASASTREGFPPVFTADDGAPGARPPAPWAWALAGGLLGAALVLWRARPPVADPNAGRVDAWRAALASPRIERAEFWRVAEDAATWLSARDPAAEPLRASIAAARYGGSTGDPQTVKHGLLEHLDAARPATRRALPRRPLAVALAVAGVALGVAFGPRPGDARAAAEVRAADQLARTGDVDQAADRWQALWRRGVHVPALAARLAWAELRAGALADAATWVVRGEGGEPRDPALRWVADRVRESGGLTGDRPLAPPVRSFEWAVLALVAALAAGWLWPRRLMAAVAALIAIVAAAALPVARQVAMRTDRAVVAVGTPLAGAGVDLQPGEVVRVVARTSGRVRVAAGRGVEGWVTAPSVIDVRQMP